MRHVRPVGKSYTTLAPEGTLARGVVVNPNTGDEARFDPEQVPDLFADNPEHVMRLVISTLDKVIRKTGTLAGMHEQAYVDRGKLANALWKKLEGGKRISLSDETRDGLKEKWRAKVHPYLRSTSTYFDEPDLDPNYKKIRDLRERDYPSRTREDLEGKWHAQFWAMNGNNPAYDEIATAILAHVFDVECKLVRQYGDGVAPPKEPKRKGGGRLARSAKSIATSAHDPRKTRASKEKPVWDDGRDPATPEDGPDADWAIYCGSDAGRDVAAVLFREACNALIDAWEEGRIFERSPFGREHFGKRIYDHFGSLKDVGYPSERRQSVFALNLAVRKHYAKIAASAGFRLTWTDRRLHARQRNKFEKKPVAGESSDRSAAKSIISRILPASWKELRRQIRGRERNADVNQLLRLGKMVIHASDIPFETPPDQANKLFHQRLDFFATSDGQSEIKRAENFNRVWRNAINVSVQSLKNLVGVDPEKFDESEENDKTDFLGNKKKLLDLIKKANIPFDQRSFVMFGNRQFKFGEDTCSRSEIIFKATENEETKRELLTLLALTAYDFRNSAFHFTTMRHVLSRLETGEAMKFASEKTNGVLRVLLRFDAEVLRTAWSDEVTALGLRTFVTNDQLAALAEQTGDVTGLSKTTTPRFKSLMTYIGHLVQAEEEPDWRLLALAKHDLDNDMLTKPGANRARVGMLRLVYQRGFETWLETKLEDPTLLSETLVAVRGRGKKRSAAYIKDRGLVGALASSRVDKLELLGTETLTDLLQRLAADATREERVHAQYRPNKARQKSVSNDLEKLRREVFAELFAEYLEQNNLNWIHEVEEQPDFATQTPQLAVRACPDADWCALFYAWLYSLPPEDVALLQHQFRKTVALEQGEKAGSRAPVSVDGSEPSEQNSQTISETIKALDTLMSLYIRVQGTGFDGTEPALKNSFTFEKGKKTGQLFESSQDFNSLFLSEADACELEENERAAIRQARRGLRQLERFVHFDDLKPIFDKHGVKAAEVRRASAARRSGIAFERERQDAKTAVIEHLNAVKAAQSDRKVKAPTPDMLKQLCEAYRTKAISALRNRFDAHAARLSDHFRAHEILRRIRGRLTDFAETWERDRACMFIGMMYQQANGTISLSCDSGKVKLAVGDWSGQTIWRQRDGGFDRHLKFSKHLDYLHEGHRELFQRYFLLNPIENPRDTERGERLKAERGNVSGAEERKDYKSGPSSIRAHLAHFKPLKRGRLTYLVNAVRSMMSYDRKLKNAVSKSITELMEREGLLLDWEMREDRLKNPRIGPKMERHLGFLPRNELAHSFELPQVSPRLASLMQGLFSFERRGHQPDLNLVGREVEYPEWFQDSFGDAHIWEGIKQS